MTKLRVTFESLETFFFRRSVEKAFQLDEQSSDLSGPPTTSVVDDVMFVLHKVLDRAMGTGDSELIKTISANCRRILDLDFAGVIKRRATIDSQRTLLGGKTDDVGRTERARAFVSGLNNLDISGENVLALSQNYLRRDLDSLFPFRNQSETAGVALLSIGGLKEKFDSYLHVLRCK